MKARHRQSRYKAAMPRIATVIVMVGSVGLLLSVGTSGGCRGDFDGAGGDDFLATGRTQSFFKAVQVDPRSEDSAGPQFVTSADLNGDGLMDLVSAWNQSQPVQIHLQRRNAAGDVSFETITLAGNVPAVSVAGVEVADFDNDGRNDIAVLVKMSLLADAGCLNSDLPPDGTLAGLVVIYMGPEPAQANQALAWQEIMVEASRLPAPTTLPTRPEELGFTAMILEDINLDGLTDIILASNASCNEDEAQADILLITNQGPAAIQDGTWQIEPLPDSAARMTIKDIKVADVDGDGDPDLVATFPDAPSLNVRWFRNPTIDVPDDFHISDGQWQVGTIGQIASGADVLALGDVDRDGITDVVVRSTNGALIQWFKGPAGPTTAPLRNLPWQVFTIAEFTERIPEAIALGDFNFDGQLELVATAEGGLAWFDGTAPTTVFDQWTENLIIDDRAAGDSDTDPATTDPNVLPVEVAGTTLMNSIEVVDLDGDGALDLVVTLDRSGLSGLTNDALVWFRNTNRPPG